MERRSLSPRHADAPLVPVIGMGTSKTLDTDDLAAAGAVVDVALGAGTTLFDSSPMYGKAERTLGACLADRRGDALVATKVWTEDDELAQRQIDDSLGFYGGRIELLQIHNMVRWPERLRQIEARRDAGQVTYVGATHWREDSFDELEAAMLTGRLDAIQVPYNPVERVVERRLLPLAADLGLGVLVMRPFAAAALLRNPPPADELTGPGAVRDHDVGAGAAQVGARPSGHVGVDPGDVEAAPCRGERPRPRRPAARRGAPRPHRRAVPLIAPRRAAPAIPPPIPPPIPPRR